MAMMYFNGEFVEESDAKTSVLDAGYYYGDGIYEVVLLNNGKFVDFDAHINRFLSCMQKAYFKHTPSKEEIIKIINEVVKRNESNEELKTASIYMQITRGTTERTHEFYHLDLQPNFLVRMLPVKLAEEIKQWHCTIVEDPRRLHCNVKVISLMPMVIAKYEAEERGFDDILFYNSRCQSMTEGSSFNLFIVSNDGKIITCPLGLEILPGCTRTRAIQLFHDNSYQVEERHYSKDELLNAREIFTTSAVKIVTAVVKVDGQQIGDGKVGEITSWLKKEYFNFMNSSNG